MTHAHDHTHENHAPSGSSSVLALALCITVAIMAMEFAGAIVFNSLTLAADSAHMLADAVALAIAVVAQRFAARPASDTHSFGWRRAEVLAAEGNAVLLLIASVVVIVEAVRRFSHPSAVSTTGMIAVASVGLVANLINTLVLQRHGGDNMNVRAAALHTASDAAGSAAAVIAGVVIAAGGSERADAVAAVVISALVVYAGVKLLRDVFRVLLEATPSNLDANDVRLALEADPAVLTVHHLHVWSLAPGAVALSAHVELDGEVTLHQAQAEGARLKSLLADRFDVHHSTLELECHPCADDIGTPGSVGF